MLYDVYPFSEFTVTGQMKKTTGHFWWGAGGIRSTPHYDQSQNFFVQVLAGCVMCCCEHVAAAAAAG